jgi:hypothetical protein
LAREWYVKLVFDGKKICFVSKITKKCVSCWRARSGLLDKQGNTQPKFQSAENKGPIPAGKYKISVEKIEKRFDERGKEKEPWKVRPKEAWGNMRLLIVPDKDTNIFGRAGGFYIHGGSEMGSIGCIDLGKFGYEEKFFRFWENNFDVKGVMDNPLELVVDYSLKEMPKDCKEPDYPPLK